LYRSSALKSGIAEITIYTYNQNGVPVRTGVTETVGKKRSAQQACHQNNKMRVFKNKGDESRKC
jgi:hypothetical protein